MFRRFLAFSTLLFVLATIVLPSNINALSAKSAVLINATTGEVLFEKDAYRQLPMASTTKIMTALLLAEEPDLTKTLVTTKEMVTVEGSSMGLLEGDTVSYYALLVGMLLASGNDAANTTAIALAGSTQAFAERMNAKAKQIGMKNTNFVTPSGLDDDKHYSTAYDMALLGAYAMKNPIFAKVCASKTIAVEYGNPPYRRSITNHNRLLSMFSNAVGIKTGFTKKSGRCLVSAAENENGMVVAVTLNAPDDWNDHTNLLKNGLSSIQKVTFNKGDDIYIDVVGGKYGRVAVQSEPTVLSLTENSKTKITEKIILPTFCYAPLKSGDIVGSVKYYYNGNEIAESPLKISKDIDAQLPEKAYQKFLSVVSKFITTLGE